MSDTKECTRCKKMFPEELIQPLVTNGGREDMCPICAQEQIRLVHGAPGHTFRPGSLAAELYRQAQEYLARVEGEQAGS